MTKYLQKSWTHSVSSGELSDEELTRRWEMVFGKKGEKKSSAEASGAESGASGAGKKKRAP